VLKWNTDNIYINEIEASSSLIFAEFTGCRNEPSVSTNNPNQLYSQNDCPKCKKELYIGNLPTELTVQKLIEILNM